MVSIIIINYKQSGLLIKCIDTIYNIIKSFPFEIIVVNNSPEENLSSLKKYSNLKVINNSNKGYSEANNKGVSHSQGEYLLFLNADTEIRNDFLKDIVERFESTNFGAAGLKMYNPDGTFQLSFWEENTFSGEKKNKNAESQFKTRNNNFIKKIEAEHSEVTEIQWASGAALFMRKEVFAEIGGFDERYFLFYEDADLCKRIKQTGRKIYFYPYSDILHYKGENVNPDFASNTYYHSKVSQLVYYKLHNSFVDYLLLRVYLTLRFTVKWLTTFNKMYLKIIKAAVAGANT